MMCVKERGTRIKSNIYVTVNKNSIGRWVVYNYYLRVLFFPDAKPSIYTCIGGRDSLMLLDRYKTQESVFYIELQVLGLVFNSHSHLLYLFSPHSLFLRGLLVFFVFSSQFYYYFQFYSLFLSTHCSFWILYEHLMYFKQPLV